MKKHNQESLRWVEDFDPLIHAEDMRTAVFIVVGILVAIAVIAIVGYIS